MLRVYLIFGSLKIFFHSLLIPIDLMTVSDKYFPSWSRIIWRRTETDSWSVIRIRWRGFLLPEVINNDSSILSNWCWSLDFSPHIWKSIVRFFSCKCLDFLATLVSVNATWMKESSVCWRSLTEVSFSSLNNISLKSLWQFTGAKQSIENITLKSIIVFCPLCYMFHWLLTTVVTQAVVTGSDLKSPGHTSLMLDHDPEKIL